MRSTYSNAHMVGFPNGDQQINTQEKIPSNHTHDKSNSSYRPLYQLSNMCLANGYSVLYGAESIPDKSAAEQVLENIKNVNITQQVLNNISKGYLTVINADSIYEYSIIDFKSIVDFWKSNVKKSQEKIQGLKGTMIFSTPDIYFKNDEHDVFMMFEDAMGRIFSNNTGMVC